MTKIYIPDYIEYEFTATIMIINEQTLRWPTFIPESIKTIRILSNHLKDSIQYLPAGLEELSLNSDYNYDLVLPQGLKILVTGENFNSKISFNDELEYLVMFSNSYKHKLKLPKNLIYCSIGNNFQTKIDLPDRLAYLSIGKSPMYKIVCPLSVTHLNVYDTHDILNIHELKVTDMILYSIHLQSIILPKELRTLNIKKHSLYTNTISSCYIPQSVRNLVIYNYCNVVMLPNKVIEYNHD